MVDESFKNKSIIVPYNRVHTVTMIKNIITQENRISILTLHVVNFKFKV